MLEKILFVLVKIKNTKNDESFSSLIFSVL